jgi:hypothetical protein
MRATAKQLEVGEAILHRSADASPDEGTSARLDALGDKVTAQAHRIDRRADRLAAAVPRERSRPGRRDASPPRGGAAHD